MFEDGSDFEVTLETSVGAVRLFAEVRVEGTHLYLDELLFFPEDAERLSLGQSQVLEIARTIRMLARSAGFNDLTVTYHRVGPGRDGRIMRHTRSLR